MKQNKFLIILLTAITLCSCSSNNSNISSNNSQNISDKYTIYFDTDGGSPINLITQDYGTIVELPTPTKDGYKFVGWIHNNKFISEKFILLKSDIKLTAYWVDENLKFTINEGFETLTITGYLDKTTTSIIIPNRSTVIEARAFFDCILLTSITIPSSVTAIEENAFAACESLKNVYYNGTIEDWCNIEFSNEYSNPMPYSKHFYMLNSNNKYEEVTSIEIPDTVTSIGNYQFYGFNNVTNITIPNNVAVIGSSAFYDCTSLASITIPSSVTIIREFAFENCTSLENVYYKGTIEDWCNIKFSIYSSNPMSYAEHFYILNSNNEYEEVTNIEISDTVTSIGYCQFRGFDNVISFTIPSSVTTIGSGAFYNCTSLASITIPKSVTTIESHAFSNCTSLTSITIPSNVTTIRERAFICCDSLTIYCEATSQPSGWDSNWNLSNCTVVWDYKNK